MKRPLFLVAAALVFTWINVGTFLWLRGAGSLGEALGHLWAAVRADWMLLVILTDAGVFVLLCLAWLWRDATKRGWSGQRRLAWLAAAVALGSPVLLVYLSLAPRDVQAKPAPESPLREPLA